MNSVSMWSMWKRVCNFYDFLKHIGKDMKQETQSEKYENNLPGLGRHKKCENKSVNHWNHEEQIEKDTHSTFLPEGWKPKRKYNLCSIMRIQVIQKDGKVMKIPRKLVYQENPRTTCLLHSSKWILFQC